MMWKHLYCLYFPLFLLQENTSQSQDTLRWNSSKMYEIADIDACYGLAVTDAGEVIVYTQRWPKSLNLRGEVRWYNIEGLLLRTALMPAQCDVMHNRYVLAVRVCGVEQVALSCWGCKCIYLGSWDHMNFWGQAYPATEPLGNEMREGQPRPYTMCRGKPGQIIVENYEEESLSIFDITQIPFNRIVSEIKIGMWAVHFCYCNLPMAGDTLAVTDGIVAKKLCMFSLHSGDPLWSVGRDEKGRRAKVAGAEWEPRGVCTDNRGKLYVADCKQYSNRIIVFSAASGDILQVMQGRGHLDSSQWVAEPGITVYGADIRYRNDKPEEGVESGSVLQEIETDHLESPKYLCWYEGMTYLIVATPKGKILHLFANCNS